MTTESHPTRRAFLEQGLRGLACAGLFDPRLLAAERLPHHRPRARRIIQLFMAGGPSHLDLFDPKPALARHAGRPLPDDLRRALKLAFVRDDAAVLASPFPFRRHGACGAPLADRLPHLARIVDRIAIVRSMHTEPFNHAPAQLFLQTGSPFPGRPSLGAWLGFGLGAETGDLPAYCVLSSGGGTSGGSANWGSGFLPANHQGVALRSAGEPILNAASPPGVSEALQRESIELVRALGRHRARQVSDPQIEARLAAFAMAERMQRSAPELMDLADESPATLALYGVEPGRPSYATNCLLARRLVERGVRCVSLFHEGWDHHSDVRGGLERECRRTDQASAALVIDLERRGLLDDTLVVWGGEFGRTPIVESNAALGRSQGRDHHPAAFTIWMAGGGVRPGLQYGATDDFGFHVVERPVHVHDLQATILHLLGVDHERLTYRYQGRDFRLTDVHGRVVHDLFA